MSYLCCLQGMLRMVQVSAEILKAECHNSEQEQWLLSSGWRTRCSFNPFCSMAERCAFSIRLCSLVTPSIMLICPCCSPSKNSNRLLSPDLTLVQSPSSYHSNLMWSGITNSRCTYSMRCNLNGYNQDFWFNNGAWGAVCSDSSESYYRTLQRTALLFSRLSSVFSARKASVTLCTLPAGHRVSNFQVNME